MRNIFVRTPAGLATVVGDLYTGKNDSFGRQVFENDKIKVEFATEYGSLLEAEGFMRYDPECGGCHFQSKLDNVTDLLECDMFKIIKVIDEKETTFAKITP